MNQPSYWNRDHDKLIPLNPDTQFEIDMAGMKAMREIILNPDHIRDAVADDIRDKFSKDDDE